MSPSRKVGCLVYAQDRMVVLAVFQPTRWLPVCVEPTLAYLGPLVISFLKLVGLVSIGIDSAGLYLVLDTNQGRQFKNAMFSPVLQKIPRGGAVEVAFVVSVF